MPTREDILIFTDGASEGNPGPAGWAAIIIYTDNTVKSVGAVSSMKVAEIGGREARATNNRMELMAAIEALRWVINHQFPDYFRLNIYSDSAYLVNGMNQWIHGWQKNGWQTKEKKTVSNIDEWKELLRLAADRKITWQLLAGHVGIAGIDRCDEIATALAAGRPLKLYQGFLADYPVKNIFNITADEDKARKKTDTRAKARAMAFSYVSLVDGKVAVDRTWAECERRVKGKTAKYRKVFSKKEEEALVEEFNREKKNFLNA
jgi:ribonuclease HI